MDWWVGEKLDRVQIVENDKTTLKKKQSANKRVGTGGMKPIWLKSMR